MGQFHIHVKSCPGWENEHLYFTLVWVDHTGSGSRWLLEQC